MYEPQVTIITPTHNLVENSYVSDFDLMVTLLSKQTYPFVEFIVMDNASNDGTTDLLIEYKNDGLLSFYSEPDQGKFDAMNKALVRAKGKYVAFLSCDDFYHDIMGINKVVGLMEEQNADFCCMPSYCRQEDGSAFVFEPAILNAFQVVPCPRQAMFFRKSALEDIKGFDSKFKLLADYDLVLRLILGGFAGIQMNDNIVTTKVGVQVGRYSVQSEAEFKHIFYKNYNPLYPMNDEILDRMYNMSEIPLPLLEKLVSYFPDEVSDEFYEKYQSMYNFRTQNM